MYGMLILIAFSCWSWSWSTPARSGEMQLARAPLAVEQLVETKLLQKIYDRAGLKFSTVDIPPLRANVQILAGEIDGEVGRPQKYFAENPGLMQITPAFYHFAVGLFARTGTGIRGTNEMSAYRIGAIRGMNYPLPGFAKSANVHLLNNPRDMYALLNEERVDLVVDSVFNGQAMIRSLGLHNIVLIAILEDVKIFHALGPKAPDVNQRLRRCITELESSGELETMIANVEAEVAQNYPYQGPARN